TPDSKTTQRTDRGHAVRALWVVVSQDQRLLSRRRGGGGWGRDIEAFAGGGWAILVAGGGFGAIGAGGLGRLVIRLEDHGHAAAFHAEIALDLADERQLLLDPVHDVAAEILVSHFAAPELERELDLVALLEELAGA